MPRTRVQNVCQLKGLKKLWLIDSERGWVTRRDGTSKQRQVLWICTCFSLQLPAHCWGSARVRVHRACVCLFLPSRDALVPRVLLKVFARHRRLRVQPEPEYSNTTTAAGEFRGCGSIIDGFLICQIMCNVSNQSWL